MSTALAKLNEGAHKGLVVAGGQKLGLEHAEQSDFVLPQIVLMQALTPWVVDGKFKAGDLVHSITQEKITDTKFLPIAVLPKYANLLKPEGNKMVWEATCKDLSDPRLLGRSFFPKDGKKADAEMILPFTLLMGGQPIVLKFKKSSYNVGKTFLTALAGTPGALWDYVYELKTKKETKGGNTFYVYEIVKVGESTAEQRQEAELAYKMWAPNARNIVTDEQKAVDETPF